MDSNEVSVGDPNSLARGSGARKSAGKPEWYQFPWWVMVPLLRQFKNIFYPADASGREYMIQVLVDDMSKWQRGIDRGLDDAAVKALALLSSEEQNGTVTLRGLSPVIRVLEFGAKKYAVGNWARGMNWSVCFNSAMSHLTKLQAGQTVDEESGLSHTAHFLCNVVFLLAYRDIFPEGDDRIAGFRPGGVDVVG